MSKEDNGGPAFPSHPDKWDKALNLSRDGMTLRDWFAGQALIATYMNGFGGPSEQSRANLCYQMADAMLEARKK